MQDRKIYSMAKSLQEQLMGSGLVDKKKAKSIQKEQRTKRKQTPKGVEQVEEVKLRAEQQKLEKAEKDRELNKLRQKEQEKKAIQAQIKQLIKVNEIPRERGEIGFQFVVETKVKKIFINEEQQSHLLTGRLAISLLGEEFILVPALVANKVIERDESAIVYRNNEVNSEDQHDEDDPYKDYEIPDDLMW